MKRESHLFSGHKFLEELGSQILTTLAKVDFRDLRQIKEIFKQVEEYAATVAGHARWEEECIFKKFFTRDELADFFAEHVDMENHANKIISAFNALFNLDSQARVFNGKLIYLDFRLFYATHLAHFHHEETKLLSLLQERATDDEIKAIDKLIYQSMTSNDMIEMLKHLLPPINFSEKKSILDDLKKFNAIHFDAALPEIRKLLTPEEAADMFVKER